MATEGISKTTRGVRNNNPGNIRLSTQFKWTGQVQGTDKDFCVFDKMENGLRAMFRLLANYHILYQVNTIREIFLRYAPPTENHTDVYARWIADALHDRGFLNVTVDGRLDWHNRKQMMALGECICQYESSYLPDRRELRRGYERGMGQLLVPSDRVKDVEEDEGLIKR